MKKEIINIIITCIILILFIVIIFIIYYTNSKKEIEIKKQEQIDYNVRFIEKNIIEFIDVIEENDINKIKNNIKNIYDYWQISILELSLNDKINKTDIIEFGKIIDKLFISYKNLNQEELWNNTIELNKQLIKIYQQTQYNVKYYNKMVINYNVLNGYFYIKNNNWIEGSKYIENANTYITEIFNLASDTESYNINLVYIAINELQNSIGIQDFDLFYIKYKILSKKLDTFWDIY